MMQCNVMQGDSTTDFNPQQTAESLRRLLQQRLSKLEEDVERARRDRLMVMGRTLAGCVF